ncbi:hypothetical protein [Sphingosinithalassobacter portus]|uniref:hypothetical protein n=1 Tax=Stakelama portus TaxID=2676234 RepID=UPI0011AB7082|nr:hypothetical protein [Sphingosinithalassobacter portus]
MLLRHSSLTRAEIDRIARYIKRDASALDHGLRSSGNARDAYRDFHAAHLHRSDSVLRNRVVLGVAILLISLIVMLLWDIGR